MPEPEEGVKDSAALAEKEGVKGRDAPTPEALREANKVAEQYRKEAEEANEALETKEAELKELKANSDKTAAERKRQALLEAGIHDDEVLVSSLEALANKGDETARAYVAKMRKEAKEIAKKEIEDYVSKKEYDEDKKRRN